MIWARRGHLADGLVPRVRRQREVAAAEERRHGPRRLPKCRGERDVARRAPRREADGALLRKLVEIEANMRRASARICRKSFLLAAMARPRNSDSRRASSAGPVAPALGDKGDLAAQWQGCEQDHKANSCSNFEGRP
jgi:hypothetical protein